MICPKCGANIADGSIFCTTCGVKLSELKTDSETDAVSESTAEDVQEAEPKKKSFTLPKMPKINTEKLPKINKEKLPKINKETLSKLKISKSMLIVVGIALAVVAVLIGIIIAISKAASGSGSNAYAYLSDGKYALLTRLQKDHSVEIANSRTEEMSSPERLLAFSPDGKYVYYYTKYDSEKGTGSLCRAEYGKLKEDTSKNDKYIEVISSNVRLGFQFLDNGTLVFRNGDDTLYYYDGKETTQIAKSVSGFYTDESKRVVYVTGDYESGYTLYGVNVTDIDNKIKLASNLSWIVNTKDMDNLLYMKKNDDGTEALYRVGFNSDSEKLGEDAEVIYNQEDAVLYTVKGKMISLYDYVTDTKADADKGITEPNIDDFDVPAYDYYMVSGSDLKESDYPELYTSCTRYLYWYGRDSWYSDSMEEIISGNDGYSDDVINATKSFIDKYGSSADGDGFIPVTEDVKKALQEINKKEADYQDSDWLLLCYTREQYGTKTDYDAYNAAYDAYYEARNRITAREELKNPDNDYTMCNLYKYADGKQILISENVLSTQRISGGLMYNTVDMMTDKPALEELAYWSDVKNQFGIKYDAENYLIFNGADTPVRMSETAAETFADAYNKDGAYLYAVNTTLFMNADNGDLYSAAVSDGTVSDFSFITDDAKVIKADGDTLYYGNGIYTNNDVTYCDLYSYKDGKAVRLAQDVIPSKVWIYEDNTVFAYTDFSGRYGYELTTFDAKGTKKKIADNVTQYIRVDKNTVLCISDNDLYVNTKKEKTRIQTDVDWIWSMKSMEPSVTMD